jgi:hypothetical protein
MCAMHTYSTLIRGERLRIFADFVMGIPEEAES